MKDPSAPPYKRDPDSSASGKGKLNAKIFSMMAAKIHLGTDSARISVDGRKISNVHKNSQMPFRVEKSGTIFQPDSSLGNVVAGEITSAWLFKEHIRDFDKITNVALKGYLRRNFFRTAAYMMNNPDFIQALNAGLLKHALKHVAKKCVDEVKKQQKQAAGCVGNAVQIAKYLPPDMVAFINGLDQTFSYLVDGEVSKLMLGEQIKEAVKRKSLTDNCLDNIYNQSSELKKVCNNIVDFKSLVRKFSMEQLATTAARDFVVNIANLPSVQTLNKDVFLSDRFKSFDGLDWNNLVFETAFNLEYTKLMPEDDTWNGAAHVLYLQQHGQDISADPVL